MKTSTLVVAALVTTTLVSSRAQAQIRYVDDDAPFNGDGTSWTTAYRYLRDALANAMGITELRVAQGIYRPDRDEANRFGTGDRTATFQLISGVALRGGYAGAVAPDPDARNIDLYEAILSGDLLGNDGPGFQDNDENSFHVVTGSNTDRTAVLDGFTISGGNATGYGFGGGIFTDSGSPTVMRCTFVANSATFGGAMNNQANSSPSVMYCVFAGNQAGTGAGIRNDEGSSPMVYRCGFTGNVANRGGAGIYSERNCHPTVIACEFIGNSALGTDPFSGGGAVHNNFLVNSTFINCTFADNFAVLGGAMMNRDGKGFGSPNPTIINCTFVGNTAEFLGGGMSVLAGAPDVTNCVFWYNSPDQIHSEPGASWTVRYSNVQGGWPGTGNIDADPRFVDPLNDDYRLSPASPCIDAGDNTAVPMDITTDPNGNPRFVDDPDTPDTGNGEPPIVDMGAYELQVEDDDDDDSSSDSSSDDSSSSDSSSDDSSSSDSSSDDSASDDSTSGGTAADSGGDPQASVLSIADDVASCPKDINRDGIVNVVDLGDLLLCFGQPDTPPCDTGQDTNGDGAVNVLDLIDVLLAFGTACP